MRERHRELGATMVEAVVGIGVLLLFICGMIEVARLLAIQFQLQVAADQTLSQAQRVVSLDKETTRVRIVERGVRLATSSLIARADRHSSFAHLTTEEPTSVLILPAVPASELEDQLTKTPIRVEFQAQVRSFTRLLPNMTLVGRSTGFREPRRMTSEPIPVDCNGNPLGSPEFQQSECPCAANCPPGQQSQRDGAGNCSCFCDPARGLIQDEDGSCHCPEGQVMTEGGCAAIQCPPGTWQNSEGKCICFQSDVVQGEAVNGKCTCIGRKKWNANKGWCDCLPAPTRGSLSYPSCEPYCWEPALAVGEDGECSVCDPERGRVVNGDCYCANDPEIGGPACPPGSDFSWFTCSCYCDACIDANGGWVDADMNNGCACPPCPAPQILVDRQCRCPSSDDCSGNQVRDPNNYCQCSCASGSSMVNGKCVTPQCERVIADGCGREIRYLRSGDCECRE